MLDELIKIFKSKIKSLEILYVVENIKPVARIMIVEKDLEQVENWCAKNNLYIENADFKVSMLDAHKKFSNKGTISDKGFLVLYISKERQKAKYAKEYEQNQDHISLGMMLGYPECCCKFFAENIEKESKRNNDFIVPITKNTISMENLAELNILSTYFDHALISHFPHKFDCPASLILAGKHLAIIQKYSKAIAKNYTSMLKCIAIYTPESVNLLYGRLDGRLFYYEKILSTKKDDLYYQLYNAKKIELINKHSFRVNMETIRRDNIIVLNFYK